MDPILARIEEMRAEEAMRQILAQTEADAEDAEQMAAELAGFGSDLGDIKSLLTAANKSPAGKVVVGRAGPIAKRLIGRRTVLSQRLAAFRTRLAARRRMCGNPISRNQKGPITAKDRAGTLPLPVKPFAILKLKAGALSLSFPRSSHNGFEVFNIGNRDQGQPYGLDAGETLTEHDTSFAKDGKLPEGHWFEGQGFDVTVISTGEGPMSDADLDVLGKALCRWHEPGDKAVTPLPLLGQMGSAQMVGAQMQRKASFFGGRPWRSGRPFVHLRSKDQGHKLVITYPDPTAEISQSCELLIEMVGVQGIVPSAQ